MAHHTNNSISTTPSPNSSGSLSVSLKNPRSSEDRTATSQLHLEHIQSQPTPPKRLQHNLADPQPLPSLSPQDQQETSTTPPGYQPPPRGYREPLFILILILTSTQFFVQGAFGSILLSLRIVGSTFSQTDSSAMSWHVAAYSLTVGTFILPSGRLGDMYGSRRLLLAGWLWFGVWSLVAGLVPLTCSSPSSSSSSSPSATVFSPSTSAALFDAARAIQGIGPALLLPNALAIAGRTYPPGRKKNVVFALFALAAPLGCVAAGAISAALAQYAWWPAVLWMYAAGCLGVAGVGLWVVPPDLPRRRNMSERTGFDWRGAVLGVAGMVLLNVAWNQAPVDGWDEPYVCVLLGLGFVFMGLFFFQEKRTEYALLDVSIFNGRVAAVLITTGLGWASFGIWFYYLFQFIQQFRDVSPLNSAAQFAPGAISGILAAIATPYLIVRISTPWLMALSCATFLAGCILQATAPVHQTYWYNTFWSFVIMAWGMDVSFPASAMILSDAVPPERQGVSASLVNTVINYSIAVGLGIAGTVESQVSHHGTHIREGYRAALWTSVGLAGIGFGFAMVFAVCMSCQGRMDPKRRDPEKSETP